MSCKNGQCGCEDKGVATTTYIVEGGLGKHIMFSAMINALAKKSKAGVINICSAYPDVFAWNDKVQASFNLDMQRSPQFKELTKELVYREPYKSNFQVDGDGHLLKYWAKELGIKWDPEWTPTNINVQDEAILSRVNGLREELGDFIVVQFTGGQAPIGFNPDSEYQNNHMQLQRNYPYAFAETLVNKIKAEWPGLNVVDFSLPNEHPGYSQAGRIELPYVGYSELVKHAKAVIGIDSSLLHMASAAGTKGIGIWGGCPAWQFGWPNMVELTNFDGDRKRFDPNDPWSVSVGSGEVVTALRKLLK